MLARWRKCRQRWFFDAQLARQRRLGGSFGGWLAFSTFSMRVFLSESGGKEPFFHLHKSAGFTLALRASEAAEHVQCLVYVTTASFRPASESRLFGGTAISGLATEEVGTCLLLLFVPNIGSFCAHSGVDWAAKLASGRPERTDWSD